MSARPKIAIVDEQPIFRIGLTQVLNKDSKYEVLAEGDSKADAIRITSELEPDVLLLDAELEGAGIETLRSLTEKSNRTRTIMLTKTESEHDMNASFQAGARGYVRKDIRADQLIDIVNAVSLGKMYMDPNFAGVLMANRFNGGNDTQQLIDTLTAREKQVLERVTKGFTNKEIAREHGLSEKTVKHHMTSILSKLQVRNRVEAAMFVREKFGWV